MISAKPWLRSRAFPLVALASISLACAATLALSCSTVSEVTTIVTVKNQAAEMSKLADDFFGQGQYAPALQYYQISLEFNSSVDNMEGISASHNSIGRVYIALREIDAARKEFSLAFDFAVLAGNDTLKAISLSNLGEISFQTGKVAEAEDFFNRAFEFARADEGTMAIILHNLGVVYKSRDENDRAFEEISKAAAINERIKRYTELASNYYMLATISSKRGDTQAAVAYLEKALDADKKVENVSGIMQDLLGLGQIYRKLGDSAVAYAYYERAFGVVLSRTDVSLARTTLTTLVQLATELDLTEDAAYWNALLGKLPK